MAASENNSAPPTSLDFDEICATLSAASADSVHAQLKRKHRSSGVLHRVFSSAKSSTESFWYGDVDGLPTNWAVDGVQIKDWSQVSSVLFHQPLQLEIAKLKEMSRLNVFINVQYEGFLRFQKWLSKFGFLVQGIVQMKMKTQQERILSGFDRQVNTTYEDFWTLFHRVTTTVATIASQVDEKMTRGGFDRPFLEVEDDGEIFHLAKDVRVMCEELEACLKEDSELTSELLQGFFNEEDEHEAIVRVVMQTLKHSSQGFVVCCITNAMHHWLNPEGRLAFRNCFPTALRWVTTSMSSKECKEFDSLLKSVYATQQKGSQSMRSLFSNSIHSPAASSSSPVAKGNSVVLTPKDDGRRNSSCDYAAMAV